MEIICVPAIVAVVYVVIEFYKKWLAKGKEKWLNLIPIIALILGGVLGVAIFYTAPQIIIAGNVWLALIVGLCSGLSAVGGNQIFKQLGKYGIQVKTVQPKDEEKTDGKE